MSRALIVSGYLTHARSLMQDIDRINRNLRNGDKVECVEAGYSFDSMRQAVGAFNYDVALIGPLNQDQSMMQKVGRLMLSREVGFDEVVKGILPIAKRRGLPAIVLSITDLAKYDEKLREHNELALIEAGARSILPWQFRDEQLNEAINSALAYRGR